MQKHLHYLIICGNDFKGEENSSASRPHTTSLVMQVVETWIDEQAAQEESSWPPFCQATQWSSSD
jgi:hypothetical protein